MTNNLHALCSLPDERGTFPMPETPAPSQKVDRFEQTGLTTAVVPGDQVDSGSGQQSGLPYDPEIGDLQL